MTSASAVLSTDTAALSLGASGSASLQGSIAPSATLALTLRAATVPAAATLLIAPSAAATTTTVDAQLTVAATATLALGGVAGSTVSVAAASSVVVDGTLQLVRAGAGAVDLQSATLSGAGAIGTCALCCAVLCCHAVYTFCGW